MPASQVVALSLQAQAVSLIVPAMGFQGVKPAAADATALTTPEGSPRGLKGPSVDAMDQTRSVSVQIAGAKKCPRGLRRLDVVGMERIRSLR